MSINFNQPVDNVTIRKIIDAFGEPVAQDGKHFLFDRMLEIDSSVMRKIADSAKQPATVELHREGEIKTLTDGTRYRVTLQGWHRLPDGDAA